MIRIFISALILSFYTNLMAQTRLDQATLEEYLKIQKDFFNQVCTPGTEVEFNRLLKEYQGNGNYIPTLLDEKIDLKTIAAIVPLLDEKIFWLKKENEKLKLYSDFKELRNLLSDMEKIRGFLIENKKAYKLSKKDEEKTKYLIEAQNLFTQLLKTVENFKEKATFLLNFKFPINHLGLRTEYEKIKESTDKEVRLRANLMFFFRKVVQDGSFDEEKSKSDMMIRAAFDTLYLSLNKKNREGEAFFLTENERVDLNFIIKNFELLLHMTPEKMQNRITEWENRVKRSREFYQDLLDNKKIKISKNSQLQDITSLLESRAKALYNLKDFVLSREAKTYEFWANKSELFQSLFVLETILYNEVGRSDEFVGAFRQDVSQVVLNRLGDSLFNQLSNNDVLLKYLSKSIKHQEKPWLNVLFKEGEFSFTYFYIPGNLQIYCPDMTRIGNYLRKDNLKIAIRVLKNPRTEFKGIRYFSRVSMLGRISMDSIWSDYSPVQEDPGSLVKNSHKLKEQYLNDQFKYLYEFKGTDNELYRVVEIKGALYVINQKSPEKIYTYRNPNLFKFFLKSKIN